jgi:lipoprotein-releasing system permease protein
MSRLPFELFLALRYLRPKRTFVSVITLISVIGVMLGVAVLIIVISVMTGFDRQLREKILGFNAHIKIHKYDDALADYETVGRAVRSIEGVKAVAPFILGPVVIKTQPASGKPAIAAPFLRGIDPALEKGVSSLTTSLISGELTLDNEDLLIGSELAQKLRLSVGDRVAIYSPRSVDEMERVLTEVKEGKRKELDEFVLPEDYTVRGIFDMGYYEYNANVIVSSIRSAQDLYQLPGKVHGLFVMLHDPYQAGAAQARLRDLLGPEFDVSIWTEDNPFLSAVAVEKNVMFFILFFIVIVAAFSIMNSQITFVVQKTREIGVMKAIGATRGQIMMLFLGQSFIIGVVGVMAGLGLGSLALAYRNEFLHFLRRTTGLEIFPASIYGFSELPALTNVSDVTIICVAAWIICVLAGLIPAWNAGRLKPVEALRHE